MQVTTATILALHCTLSLAIRVPTVWSNANSEVNRFAIENFQPQNVASSNENPVEYFQYPAQKPKFAVDIAKFHGVRSPENHYKAYPVKPHTGVRKPELGKHQMLNEDRNIFRPYQEYVKKSEAIHSVTPSTTSYEVFHPYKLEEPALKELYRDPVMDKIRNDLFNAKNRLQKYENESGESDIPESENLEDPEETDRKKVPHRNVPAPYETHLPQRRPVYYTPPFIHNNRDQVSNQKLRHPWHQNYVKVRPIHYRPVKSHLQKLRQQHALKYDDENNEYPQLPVPEKEIEPSEGYDIYEKGKAKFVQLRNNVDESINEAVQKNTPIPNQKAETNNDEPDEDTDVDKDEDDFVPIKNYAQVRKTETTKHLPREAAYDDAESLDEIINAPRLREAIKSTKAQTVYSEEGYEDSAYDHAGEQKHASDHEAHGGFLKEKESSEGKYKIPTFSTEHNDEEGIEYRNQVLDGKKWKNNKKDTKNETELEEYSDNEQEYSSGSDAQRHSSKNNENNEDDKAEIVDLEDVENDNIKRKPVPAKTTNIETSYNSGGNTEHDLMKREAIVEIPEIKLNSNNSKEEVKNSSKLQDLPKTSDLNYKYPYYSINFETINKDSPLRYAENLELIPKKSEGGTEFYDSRSQLECPEVDDNVDPIPEKLKKGGHPDEDEENEDEDVEDNNQKDKSDFSTLEQKPRLRGLGDKIDCFKAKYFGQNPLDSPFFKEDIISNPEPVTIPSIDIYKLKQEKEKSNTNFNPVTQKPDLSAEIKEKSKIDTFTLIEKLYPKQNTLEPKIQVNIKNETFLLPQTKDAENPKVQFISDNVKEKNDIRLPIKLRKRRATPFVYEPYKIIRDGQVQDSKKTTTTNNISPLIKQLQSSRVVDKVTPNSGKEQVVKRNAGNRGYKDIGKNERENIKRKEKGTEPINDASFVDVSIDQRRGEPRYELRPVNHKNQYTPVENKKSMTAEDYKEHTNINIDSDDSDLLDNKNPGYRKQTATTIRPFFDVSKFLPSMDEEKNDASSDKIEMVIRPRPRSDKSKKNSKKIEEYDEDDIDVEEEQITTMKTLRRNQPRRRITRTSTTAKPEKIVDLTVTDAPKLRLKTRFRDSYQAEAPAIPKREENTNKKLHKTDGSIAAPKYRQKKKKSLKSTLVTDTKSYGEDDDDDDLGKDEVDALIGVKEDDADYLPTYEKQVGRDSSSDSHSSSQADDEDYNEDEHSYENDEDEDDDDEDSDEDDEDDEDDDDESDNEPEVTTPEPTKRTLTRTTEATPTTTEARSAKLEMRPVISMKKLEIHKELPVNRSSPHIIEFKQDIKEEEVIKEMPSKLNKKPQKHVEALQLYKDENLAKDINKLGGVEIFKEDLDLVNGPKHGGNYRSAETLNDDSIQNGQQNQKSSKGDVVASQSKTLKLVEPKENSYSRRRGDIQRARNNRGRSAKFIELSDATERPLSRPMHGGNFKSIHDVRRRGGSRNAKIIELDDHNPRDGHSTSTNGRDFKSYGSRGGDRHQMHGGNYRSAKLVQADDTEDKLHTESENVTEKNSANDNIRDEVVFDTPPSFILDPSKRMYFYVEA